MNIIYAIYKENIIPLVGGVNPDGIETGLAEYNDWKLCAMEESEFNKYAEFRLYPVPKSIAVGMALLNKGSYQSQQDDIDGEIPSEVLEETNLSEEEEKLAIIAKNFIDNLELKFIVRAKVRQFKDFEDDLADTKLLIEFLIGYMAEDYSQKTQSEKDNFPLKSMMETFVLDLKSRNLRINNEKFLKKIPKILKDESFISRIVKSTYKNKK